MSHYFYNTNKKYKPRYEKENGFRRIAMVNSLGAIILAPILALSFYFVEAPTIYIYLSLSYAIAFPIYVALCYIIKILREQLIYILFIHLAVIAFASFVQLLKSNFNIDDFFYFLIFYGLSTIIIQRLYSAMMFQIFILSLLSFAYMKVNEPAFDFVLSIPFFFLIGSASVLMIYARSTMMKNMEDYSEYLKKIMNNPGSGYILFDLEKKQRVVDYNQEALTYFSPARRGEASITELFFEQFDEKELMSIRRLKLGSRFLKSTSLERYNSIHEIEFNIGLITLKNNTYWLANINDVTYLKKEQRELQMSEKKYRNLYYKNRAGVFTIDENSVIIDGNESFYKMFDNTLNKGDQLFDSHELRTWSYILDTIQTTGSSQNYQTQYTLKNGVVKTFIFNWYIDDRTLLIEGSVIDLTKIQEASQALKLSEQKYKMIFEESNDAIFLLNGDRITDLNKRATELFGFSEAELKKKNLFDLSFDTSKESYRTYLSFREKLSKRKSIKFDWIYRSDDNKIEAEVSLIEIQLDNNLFYQCVIHDQTKQKRLAKEQLRAEFAEETNARLEAEIKDRIKAELKLQEQFLRTKAILDSSSNTFLLTCGLNGKITSFNSHSAKYFKSILGKDIEKEKDIYQLIENILNTKRKRLFRHLVNEVNKGVSKQFEVRLETNSGTEYWLEVYMNPIFDTIGKVAEISLVAHDVSEKKKVSLEIEESLKEKEVLLKEIHHRVKNNLQVISSILNLQGSFVDDEKTLSILQESRNRVRSMAIIHEYLYKTKDFSSINFGDYIKNLTHNLIASYQIGNNIRMEAEIGNVAVELDQAIPCGLLVNELITNALKYAWDKNEKGIIKLVLKEEGNRVVLELGDDGKGLPADFEDIKTETLGLQLVATLVEQLDGDLKVDTSNGTNYLLTFEHIKAQNDVKN